MSFRQQGKLYLFTFWGGHAELSTATKQKNLLYVFPSLCLIPPETEESQEWRHPGSHGVWSGSFEAFTEGC